MGRSIAVMNTKGGVGKSTIVMALAETLSAHHGRNVLVIDSDSQTSMSIMLMDMARWELMERQKLTLVDFLSRAVLGGEPTDWKPHVATGVSDVEEARSVYLLPSHMQLSLFERMISGEHKHAELRARIRDFLNDAKRYFDVILIDCPPGLSVLTETWLRESDYFLPPVKPDYLSVRGLEILKRFRSESESHGFAELLGVVINLKDGRIQAENHWHGQLAADPDNRCFGTVIPRRAYLQRAADYETNMRTFLAKYPGDAGQSIVGLVGEMLERIQSAELERAAAATSGAPGEARGPGRTTVQAPQNPILPPGETARQEQPIDLNTPVSDDHSDQGSAVESVVQPDFTDTDAPVASSTPPGPRPDSPGRTEPQDIADGINGRSNTQYTNGAGSTPLRTGETRVSAPDPTLITNAPPPPRPGRYHTK